MKAVILIGGQGTRLRPLTCNTPKAMVPILNRPFLEHLLLYLKKHGVHEVILAMGYMPGAVQSHLGDGSRLGIRVLYSVEESPLGTAGAIKNAESFLDGTFLVFNGDILTDIDLTGMIRKHHEMRPEVSIALTPVEDPSSFGVVETDARGMVRRFLEKPSPDKITTNLINAGIYILEPEVLKHIPVSTYFMFERNLFPMLLEMGKPILSYPSDAYWIDIGTPEKYLKVNRDLLLKQYNAVQLASDSQIDVGAQIIAPVITGTGCVIERGTQIIGPAVIGPDCIIGRNVRIEGSVLWAQSRIEEGAVIKNSVIGCQNCVGKDCIVSEDCILGDNITLISGMRLEPGSKIYPGTCTG